MKEEIITKALERWLNRKTRARGVRRVADLPFAIASDTGIVRTGNQDRCIVLRVSMPNVGTRLVAAILADGMGGMADGAKCASLASSAIAASLARLSSEPMSQRLKSAAEFAKKKVFDAFRGRGGSTLSVFAFSGSSWSAINTGDSRIYSFKDEKLKKLSVDDTLKEQIPRSHGGDNRPGFNDLLQYVGIGDGLEPHEIVVREASFKSRLLITSDGTHMIGDDLIGRICTASSDPAHLVQRLVEIARWSGGPDNASAICVDLAGLASLSGQDIDTEALQVWDPFGELEILLVPEPKHENQYHLQDQQNELLVKAGRRKQRRQTRKLKQSDSLDHPQARDERPHVQVHLGEGGDDEEVDPNKP